MVLTQTKENLKSIYNEIFGERTDHPFIARLLAFLVDYVLFLMSGPIIYSGLNSIKKHSTLNQLLIGIVLWTTYFTLGNSRIFKGQTIGKKLLRIRTVDNEGNYLGLIKSLMRSFLIVLLMNSYQIMYFIVTEQNDYKKIALSLLTMILMGTIYFPLLKMNRQGLHDILVSSQVVPQDRKIKIGRKINFILILGFAVIVIAYLVYVFGFLDA